MRHLLCVLAALVCLPNISALPQDTTKNSPLEGWTVLSGEWRKEKDGVATSEGYLQWNGEIRKRIQIDFVLTVRKWSGGGPQLAGIIWNAGHEASGANGPVKPRNLALVRGQGIISTYSQPDRQGFPRRDTPYTLPLGRPTRVRAIITKRGISLMVGTEKLTAEIPSEELGKLQLHVNGADAVFTKIKVKAK